jgi:predicted membrane-bound spermidine synthase
MLQRIRVVLVALWLGLVVTLATVAAPTAFAVLERTLAGRVAGQMFRIEATVGLGLAMLLFLIERRVAMQRAAAGRGSVLSAEIVLVLGALFCTVLGYFALQPLMEAARAGQGAYSFGMLHGVSSALFALKGLLLLALLWRSAGASAG